MGNNEGEKPAKSEKPASPPREQNNVHVYPDWGAVQAYYGPGAIPPPFFNPAVTSGHAAHPYMWAPPQMMPPYGSPYAALYPPGGIYGPSAAPVCVQVATPLSLETSTRSSGNESGSAKKPKESDVPVASGNGNAESAGDACTRMSQSTDCGTEGSCDRSDDSSAREDDNSRDNNGTTQSGTCHVQVVPYPGMDANSSNGIVPGIPLASVETIRSSPMPIAEMNHSSNAHAASTAVNCTTRPAGIQDEREMKREKRKQSNRESARRSRLRKQAEMEELGKKVDALTVENMALRSEIKKLMEDSGKLRSENAALMEKLEVLQGPATEVDQEKSDINTENLLSRVNNSVSNGDHERDGEEK